MTPRVGERVRHRLLDRTYDGTVRRLSLDRQFLVAFDDGRRQWFDAVDLGGDGPLALRRLATQPPARQAGTTRTLSFLVDAETQDLIRELEQVFDVRGPAAVVKRALALSRIACASKDADGVATLVRQDGSHRRVALDA